MEKIIGHEKVKAMLNKIIEENKIGHAYLFSGKEGIGKKMLAIQFARKIMTNDGLDAFNESDFKIITPEKDLIKVEEIRNLIGEVYLKPIYSKRKVFIIDDADKMNASAQNALLKVLEEPPLYATIILIVASKEKIIRTIKSRVTEIEFDVLTNDELKKIVGDNTKLQYARGSVSKAISLLNDDYYDVSKEIVELFNKKSFLDINRKINLIKENKDDIVKILEFIKLIYYGEINENTYVKVKIITLLDETIKSLNRNANTDLTLDRMIIKICNV